jgi:subtilisin family serine protease
LIEDIAGRQTLIGGFMRLLNNIHRIRYLYISLLLFVVFTASGQETKKTPVPDTVMVAQGGSNLGLVQPFSLAEIMINTGIQAGHDANQYGQGRRVGILDLAFGNLSQFLSQHSLSVSLFSGEPADYDASSITHGTDVLEIIHTIAPDAEYYLCQYGTYDDFVSCIDWMLAADVHIINHSVGVPVLPLNGDSAWALEVDRAARAGAIWVNAAGNFAGGYVEDFFTDNNNNGFHEFRGIGIAESLLIEGIEQPFGRIMLSWEGANGTRANEINLELEVLDRSGSVITESRNIQAGEASHLPLEIVTVDMRQPFAIRISNLTPRRVMPADGTISFALFVEFADISIGRDSGSIIAPADSINAITVGALQGTTIAPYSSRGPVASGGLKPDITAPGEIILSDGRQFIGTSAAAPIIAGAAAIIWGENPDWEQDAVIAYIKGSTYDDTGIPGPDSQYGIGIFTLGGEPPDPVPTVTSLSTISVTETTPVAAITSAATNAICGNVLNPQLTVEQLSRVRRDSVFLVDYAEAVDNPTNRLGQVREGAVVQVLDRPVCEDNEAWFQVKFGRQIGWIRGADANESTFYADGESESIASPCLETFFFYGGAGCPDAPAATVWSAYQPFERGFMLWRMEPDEVWVLLNDGSFFYFTATMIAQLPDNPLTELAPSGFTAPVSGFGRAWGNTALVHSSLGWALGNEHGYDAQMQHSKTIIDGSVTQMIYFALPDGSVIEIALNDKEGWRRV